MEDGKGKRRCAFIDSIYDNLFNLYAPQFFHGIFENEVMLTVDIEVCYLQESSSTYLQS